MHASLIGRLARVVALVAAIPALALAQNGRISGTVTDGAKAPVVGAQVIVTGVGLSAETGADGKYSIGVSSGKYDIKIYRIGYKAKTVSGISVAAGQSVTADIALEKALVQLGGVVVSASRRVEKLTDAPAQITNIDALAIANTIGNSFAPALKNVPGLDFIQVGVTAAAVNARGFNSSFNTRMLLTEDGRIATLPESGLPVGTFTTLSKVDLANIEILTGPGSALYGPEASNGVITLATKDPRQSPGYTFEVSGGSRNFYDVQGRYAGVNGKWGYKVTGEYQSAHDYDRKPIYPIAGKPPQEELSSDFNTNVLRGNGALAYYFDNGARLAFDIGASKSNAIGQTNLGRNQLVDWQYRHIQLKYTGQRWFAQAYETQSLSGGTYQLNAFTVNTINKPTLTADSVKKLSAFPDDARLQAAEIQNNFTIGMLGKTGVDLIDNTHIVYGAQFRRDRVSTFMHWLTDRKTGQAVIVNSKGYYGQIETPLSSMFRTVLSGRYDQPDRYDAQFTPKAALLFTPVADQTFRLTYGKAYKSPTILMTDFYFPNFAPSVGVFGNTTGFDIKNAAGVVTRTIDPIKPETNNTWELGYKGEIANRLFVDVTGYHTKYTDFHSPLSVIANPFAGTNAYYRTTGAKVTDDAGNPQVALAYFNLGEATISGLDAGLKFYFTDNISASGNVSLIKVDTIVRKTGDPAESSALNTTSAKFNGGMDFTNIAPNTTVGFGVRYVNRYDFQSGVNWGLIPSFGTLDLTASYQIPNSGARITVQAQNIFSCIAGVSTPPATGIASSQKATYTSGQKCGFGQTHQEMLNMPAMGPLVFVGIRWDGR